MKRILKRMLLNICYYGGLFEISRLIMTKKGYVPILLYHRVPESVESGRRKSSFHLWGLDVSKAEFQRQMSYLKRNYRVISLKSYEQARRRGQAPSGCALITFDDGFKDSSIEVLKKYGFPATFFIIGECLQTVFWRHGVFLLFDATREETAEIELYPREKLALSFRDDDEKREAIGLVLSVLQDMPAGRRDAALETIRQHLKVDRPFVVRDAYLDAEAVKRLSAEGLSFGAHSMTHRDLTRLDDDDLVKEVKESRDLLEKLTGESAVSFSVPFGRHDERTEGILKKLGILCNVTGDDGLNSAAQDVYRLRRLYINSSAFPEFLYKISGAEMLWSRISSFLKKI